MNVDIRDAGAIRALRPLEVVSYLRSHGWKPLNGASPKAAVWTFSDERDEFEAMVPLDQALGDYALRMAEVLQAISAVERRSQGQVYADLLTTFADVVRIRIDDPELQDGTLPLEAYAQMGQKARDLLLAAACSATEHRAVWHTRKPPQAVEQVRKIRVGQTERGSYIVTVVSRVSPELHAPSQEGLFETDQPFERRVIQTLATSLSILDKAAASAALSGEFPFEESVSRGVSANLCDAVVGLWGDESGQRNLEFMFSWSPARRVEIETPSLVKFAADRIPVIREAARLMRERAPIADFELNGAVVKLQRAQGEPTGRVTVMGQVDGKARSVVVELGDRDYHLAVQAHVQEKALHCVGSLTREGRGYALSEPREFAVEET